MTQKGVRPDLPDLVVLPLSPSLGQVRRIGTEQASIIVGTGRGGRQHWVHPNPIIGRQQRGMHHGGGP